MTLVLVHGSGSCGYSYHYQTQHFPDADAPDLPGHPVGKPCTSVEGYTEWVRGYIRGKGYKDVVLGGHSLGGAIVQWYALNYPDELKAIVLIGTGARLRVHPAQLEECRKAVEDPALRSEWLKGFERSLAQMDPAFRAELLKRRDMVGPATQLNDLLCCDRFDVMGKIENIRLPTLVINGTEDEMTPVKYADYLANKIPGAWKVIIPGATHAVMRERPAEVNRAIEEFLSGLA